MADITGRPKAPQSQVVYVPQYIYSGDGSTGAADKDPAPTPEQQREKTLLSRGRSRMGTILTGFRGILAQSDTQSQRKTLLGE